MWKKAFLLVVAMLTSTLAYSLPIELDSDGVVWSWSSGDIGKTAGSLTLFANVSGSTLNNGDGAFLHAFLLKKAQTGDTFVVDTAYVEDPDTGWSWTNNELSAGGCHTNGGSAFNLCFYSDEQLAISDSANFMFKIKFTMSSGVLTDALHLKVDWVTVATLPEPVCTTNNGGHVQCTDPKWETYKTGSLVSADFLVTPNTPTTLNNTPGIPIPLPGTLTLLGLGLANLGWRRRAANTGQPTRRGARR